MKSDIALYEKVLVDEAVFSDYFEKCSDSVGIKKMKKKIQDSVKEYELSYRCGLLSESEKEHADLKEKLSSLNIKISNKQNNYCVGDKVRRKLYGFPLILFVRGPVGPNSGLLEMRKLLIAWFISRSYAEERK